MIDTKIKTIDLRPFGISRIPDVRVIKNISYVHTQNWELSHVIVRLTSDEELKGRVHVGSGGVHDCEAITCLREQALKALSFQ